MAFKVKLSVKQIGGYVTNHYGNPIIIQKNNYLKLGGYISDDNGQPVTITAYTVVLRLPTNGGGLLEKTATPIDNNKGEVEFAITAAESATLKVVENQTAEVKCFLTASPEIICYDEVENGFSVVDTIYPVA